MNPEDVGASMAEPVPKVPTLFIVVTFAAAIAIGAVVIYLGINGLIGGPIP